MWQPATTPPPEFSPVLGAVEFDFIGPDHAIVFYMDGQWYFQHDESPVANGVDLEQMGHTIHCDTVVTHWQHLPTLPE